MNARILATIGGAALSATILLLIYNFLRSPIAEKDAWLQTELASLSADWEAGDAAEVNLQAARDVITSKPALWRRLIAPPPPPRQPINVLDRLQGIQVTRQTMGSGETIKIRMVTPQAPRGAWFKKGDVINGAVIKEISSTSVVFSVMDQGQEYLGTLLR